MHELLHAVSPLWPRYLLLVRQPIGHVLNENMLDVISQQRQDINNLAAKHQQMKKSDKPHWILKFNIFL